MSWGRITPPAPFLFPARLMKFRFISALVLIAFVLGLMVPAQRSVGRLTRDTKDDLAVSSPYVPGELLVKIKGGAESRAAMTANQIVGATQIEQLGISEW